VVEVLHLCFGFGFTFLQTILEVAVQYLPFERN
jgi:hypothetical protein